MVRKGKLAKWMARLTEKPLEIIRHGVICNSNSNSNSNDYKILV